MQALPRPRATVVGTKGSGKGELAPHKAKQKDRKHQELLALALGVNLGSKGALLWKPLKILACSQISPSPLSRRTTIKDGPEKHCNYEKIHNFKVGAGCVMFISCLNYDIYTVQKFGVSKIIQINKYIFFFSKDQDIYNVTKDLYIF